MTNSTPLKKMIDKQADDLNLNDDEKAKLKELYEEQHGNPKISLLQEFDKRLFTK